MRALSRVVTLVYAKALPRFHTLTPQNEPLSGIPVHYYGCAHCDFIFTTRCDNWAKEDFNLNIYNDRYVEVDPYFVEVGPINQAKWSEQQYPLLKGLKILDFGPGTGFFASWLNSRRWDVSFYDPFCVDSVVPEQGT